MANKRKGRLVPIKKQVYDPKANKVIDRTYWINPDKFRKLLPKRGNKKNQQQGSLQDELQRTFTEETLQQPFSILAEKISSFGKDDEVGIKILEQSLGRFRKNASQIISSSRFLSKREEGMFNFITREIILSDDVGDVIARLPVIHELGKLGKQYKPAQKIGLSNKSKDDQLFNDFVSLLMTPLHEHIHAASMGNKEHDRYNAQISFEEGATHLITMLFAHQFIKKATNGFIDLEKIVSADPSRYIMVSQLLHPYLPYMHRLASIGRYLNIPPDKYAELLVNFKLGEDTSNFEQRYPDFLLHLEFEGINVPDRLYDIASLFGNYYDSNKGEYPPSVLKVAKQTGNVVEALRTVMTDFGKSNDFVHNHLKKNKKFYKIFNDVSGSIDYMTAMIKHIQKNYPTFDDIESKLYTRENWKKQNQNRGRWYGFALS